MRKEGRPWEVAALLFADDAVLFDEKELGTAAVCEIIWGRCVRDKS